MSVVAVKVYKDKIIIGADSFIGFTYDTQLKDKDVKIFQHKNITVGCVGYAADCTFLRLYSKTREPSEGTEEAIIQYISEFIEWAKKRDTNYKLDSSFMIVFQNKAFLITSNFYVKDIKEFEAMGAGMVIAQTALKLGKDVYESIKITCDLSIYCEEPINIYEILKEHENPAKES